MDSSSTLIFYDSNSDDLTQPDETMNIIDITQRIKRLYQLTDRIRYRKMWKKFANKIRLKNQIRVINKLFKLNFGFRILNIRYMLKYYRRWKYRAIFVSMSRQIIFKYRINNIRSSVDELSLEYFQNYKEKWQMLAKNILINNRKMRFAELFRRRTLFKQFFYFWLSQFNFRQNTTNELKDKWISFTQNLIYQNTIFIAYQLKWQLIAHKLVMKNMSEFYQEEKMRSKWIQILHQYYFHNKREILLRNKTHLNLQNCWIQISKKYKIKCLQNYKCRSKLPALFLEYIRMQKQKRLHEMNQKLISTKDYHNNIIRCRKIFINWHNSIVLSKKVKILSTKALNASFSLYTTKIENDAAKTIQKLCRFQLNKMNFRKQLKKWKMFEYWHFKTDLYKKIYPKLKVPHFLMEIELNGLNFDKFTFVKSSNYLNKIDFVKDVFEYKKTKEINRADFVPLNKVKGFDISRSINSLMQASQLSLSFLLTNDNDEDVIRPKYQPDNEKQIDRVTSRIGEKFDFNTPLISLSMNARSQDIVKKEKKQISLPNITVRHSISTKRKFPFKLLLFYQDVSNLTNFSKHNALDEYIQKNTSPYLIDDMFDENLSKSNEILVKNMNFSIFELESKKLRAIDLPPNFSIDFKDKLNFNFYQFKKNKIKKQTNINLFEFPQINYNTSICRGFSKRVKSNSSICSREIKQKVLESNFSEIINTNILNPLVFCRQVKIPAIENVSILISTFKQFKDLSIPNDIVNECNQADFERFVHVKEKMDFSVQRKISRAERISKRIELNYSSLLKYDFAKCENISEKINNFQLPIKNVNHVENIVPQFNLTKPILFLSNIASKSIHDEFQLKDKIIPQIPETVITSISKKVKRSIIYKIPFVFNEFLFDYERIVVKHRLDKNFEVNFDTELNPQNDYHLIKNRNIKSLNFVCKQEIPKQTIDFLFFLDFQAFPISIEYQFNTINRLFSVPKPRSFFSKQNKSIDLPRSLLPFKTKNIDLKLPDFILTSKEKGTNPIHRISSIQYKANSNLIIDDTDFELSKKFNLRNFHVDANKNIRSLNAIINHEVPSQKIDFLLTFDLQNFPVTIQNQLHPFNNLTFTPKQKFAGIPQTLLPLQIQAIKLKVPDFVSKDKENVITPLIQYNDLKHNINSSFIIDEIDFENEKEFHLHNRNLLFDEIINTSLKSLMEIQKQNIKKQKLDILFDFDFKIIPISKQNQLYFAYNFVPIHKHKTSIKIPRSLLPLQISKLKLKLPDFISKTSEIKVSHLQQVNNDQHNINFESMTDEIDFEFDKEFENNKNNHSILDDKINININCDSLNMIRKTEIPSPNIDIKLPFQFQIILPLKQSQFSSLNNLLPAQNPDKALLKQERSLNDFNHSFFPIPTPYIKLKLPNSISIDKKSKVNPLYQIYNNYQHKLDANLIVNETDFKLDEEFDMNLQFDKLINIDIKSLMTLGIIHEPKISLQKIKFLLPFDFKIILPARQSQSYLINAMSPIKRHKNILSEQDKHIEIPGSLLPIKDFQLKLPEFIFTNQRSKIKPLYQIRNIRSHANSNQIVDEMSFDKKLKFQFQINLPSKKINQLHQINNTH